MLCLQSSTQVRHLVTCTPEAVRTVVIAAGIAVGRAIAISETVGVTVARAIAVCTIIYESAIQIDDVRIQAMKEVDIGYDWMDGLVSKAAWNSERLCTINPTSKAGIHAP